MVIVRPEQMDRTNYDEKVDIYSLGIILYEMHRLFYSSHERHMEIQCLKRKLFLPSEFHLKFPKQSSLILSMVLPDASCQMRVFFFFFFFSSSYFFHFCCLSPLCSALV
jgi:serine/threonine protein kinase